MTTSPNTVHAADATIAIARLATTTADLATSPTTPASAGSIGGTTRTVTRTQPRPDLEEEPTSMFQRVLVGVFVAIPLLALVAAIPLMWGWGLGWHDVVIALVFYWVSGLGITVGYHRYFTHGSFKAKTGLRVALAIAGSLAIEGPVITWVSDHRRHHKYSDKEGDPHSPWRYGDDWKALSKGLVYAHIGWLFDPNKTSQEKFSPDLLADRRIKSVDAWFPGLVAVTLLLPPLIGFLWGMSWQGALTAFFWASLVRVALLHHVTWSINSICHTFGSEEFEVRDKSQERVLDGDRVLRRILAQPAPRGPHLRPARSAEGPARPERARDLGLREAGLGLRRALAGRGTAFGQASGHGDAGNSAR